MSELRYNVIAKEWVIIATERAKRPEDFKRSEGNTPSSDTREKCPFCPGHENKTPAEIFAFRPEGSAPNSEGWRVRVIPNQFPMLTTQGNTERRKTEDIFMSMDGFGTHEVIIENPDHGESLYTMGPKQVEEVFFAYRRRYIELAKDPRFEAVILFKNYGFNAGTSLVHPHSQVVATPITPMIVRWKVDVAQRFFDDYGQCLYCRMIEKELKVKERIVLESPNFLVIEPFASHSPFETFILPKWHASNFDAITGEQCGELAQVMQTTLKKIKAALGGPDYNYVLFSAPTRENNLEHYHWHFKIMPRVVKSAGFELGSGMFVNPMIPEVAAKALRDAVV